MQRAVTPTPRGTLLLVLHTHLPWVLGHGRWPHGESWLYEAAAECYLPILRLLARLETEDRKGSVTLGVTPVLAGMLSTPRFRDGFLAYLGERAGRADADRREFETSGDEYARGAAVAWSEFYKRAKEDFLEKYNGDLLSALVRLQESGRIEIIVSAATHGYLPLLGRDESIEAQLGIGITSYRRRFGRRPRGIWLPECAYRPGYAWSRPVGPAHPLGRKGSLRSDGREGTRGGPRGALRIPRHRQASGIPGGHGSHGRRRGALRHGTLWPLVV